MIADTSQWVVSFNGYPYGSGVATLTEDLPQKLSTTNIAGRLGKRIGENFQDIRRLIVDGTLSEDSAENMALADPLTLRVIVQRFRAAHRGEVGKQKLYLHSAADGRPAEFVWAAVENITGLKWESPITETDFEISFVAEPEVWYDSAIVVNLIAGRTTDAFNNVFYSKSITYAGPDSYYFADAEGLPFTALTVSSLNTDQLGTTDPPYIQITNNQGTQVFTIYPDDNVEFDLDSYNETIRKILTGGVPEIWEMADYDQFLYLAGNDSSGGMVNNLMIQCHYCDLSAAQATYYARHF